MKLKRFVNIFFVLSIIEGIFPIIFYFSTPSMDKNAVILGFSLQRLLLGLGLAGIWLLFCVFEIYFLVHSKGQKKILRFLESGLDKPQVLLSVLSSMIYTVLALLASFWLFAADISIDLNMLEVVYGRLFWYLIWILLLMFQGLVILFTAYRETIYSKSFWDKKILLKVFLIFSILGVSAFHWAILIFQIQFLVSIPYWTWFFQIKEADNLIFVILILISAGLIYWIIKKPNKTVRNLILLVFLGYFVQVGFGFVAGGGYETLRSKAVSAGHVKYLEYAVDNLDISEAIFNYEEAFGWDVYLGTKPPGVLIFYILDQKLSNSFSTVDGYWARFDRLSRFNAFIFPLLTFLGLIPLYYFARIFIGDKGALYSCILYIFLPNVVLMPMELDVVVFPAIFLIGLLLTWQVIQKRSTVWALVLGAYLYLAVYFTFSMLPLIPLCMAWIGLDYLLNVKKRSFWEVVKLGLLIGVSFLAFYFLAYFLLNYDPLLRYQNAMIKHKSLKQFETGLDQIFKAIKLNNLEIASWVGFPVALLSVVFVIRSLVSLIKTKFKPLHILTMAFFITYLALNLVGQTRGEVGRLWIFMDPLIIIFAVSELLHQFKNPKWGVWYLYAIQLLTVYFTFRFQDFW